MTDPDFQKPNQTLVETILRLSRKMDAMESRLERMDKREERKEEESLKTQSSRRRR